MQNWEQLYKAESVKLDKLGGAVTNWQQAEESKNWSKAALRVKGGCLLPVEVMMNWNQEASIKELKTHFYQLLLDERKEFKCFNIYSMVLLDSDQTVIKWQYADNSKTDQLLVNRCC